MRNAMRQPSRSSSPRLRFALLALAGMVSLPVPVAAAATVFHLESPYRFGAHQHKVQLHCHSTDSDGQHTPTQVMQLYATAGYAAVALTDHDWPQHNPRLTDPGGHGIIHIPGVEYSEGGVHMLGIHISAIHGRGGSGLAARINQATAIRQDGGFAYIAHPWDHERNWQGWNIGHLGHPSMRYDGMEILNAGNYINDNITDFPYKVDAALTMGREIRLIAVDDFHHSPASHLDRGFVVINSDVASAELTLADVVAALRAGNFFAAGRTSKSFPTPPRFNAIQVDGHTITVQMNRQADIEFITFNNNYYVRRQGRAAYAHKVERTLTASYTVAADDTWIRIKASIATSAGPAYAWSNPIYVRDGAAPAGTHPPVIHFVGGQGRMRYERARGDQSWRLRLSRDMATWAAPEAFGLTLTEDVRDVGAYREEVEIRISDLTEPLFLQLIQD
jgi:hypothetical protein